jgi:hypothetical protein
MKNGTDWSETYLNEMGGTENGSCQQEQIFFDRIAIQIREAVFQYNVSNKGAKRVNHAKILVGFQKAIFKIADAAVFPADLAYGFLVPGAQYETIVRFSNTSGKCISDDATPDLRGIALRVLAPNGAHDLLMTNAEDHHASNAQEAMLAINAGVDTDRFIKSIPLDIENRDYISKLHRMGYLIKNAGEQQGLRIFNTFEEQARLKVSSLSTETYWSRAAFAVGNATVPGHSVAVKFRLVPTTNKASQEDILPEENLGQKMLEELRLSAVKFDFEIQRYLNPVATPIEDTSVRWTSRFEKIAELIIPQGALSDNRAVDELAFNPWNVDLRHFLPLGNMNRARKKVYTASADERKRESPQ